MQLLRAVVVGPFLCSLLLSSGLACAAWHAATDAGRVAGRQAAVKQQLPRLVTTLSRGTVDDTFRLTIYNAGQGRAAVCRWFALYDVRVYSAEGDVLSDFKAYLDSDNMPGPAKWDWVVLRAGDAVSFPVAAYTRTGQLRLPGSAVAADCVANASEFRHLRLPEWCSQAGARLMEPPRAGRTRLVQ
jgi:hypothetical protein